MTTTIDPPTHDPLLEAAIPEAPRTRPYSQLVAGLMEAWDCSKPEAERKMESYTLAQCETLLRRRWLGSEYTPDGGAR